MSHQEVTCPHCGSHNIAEILWGMPVYSDEFQKALDEGKVVLGGCCVSFDSAKYYCNVCETEFGLTDIAKDLLKDLYHTALKGIVYGAAVGDALGVPYEFQHRDTFTCKDMSSGGVHQVPKGTFSDDTSMLLATADSIRERGSVDPEDMRAKYCAWLNQGAYTADGNVFDVGNATATALAEGRGQTHEMSNGNGSLMRIAPLACTDATDDEIRAVSAITHAHSLSQEACVCFVHILRALIKYERLTSAIKANIPQDPRFDFMRGILHWSRDEVKSTGFVLDTLGASLWCALNSNSYDECVLKAVNLGDDTDTTASVAGTLAGTLYGYDTINKTWIEQLRGKDLINNCLF